MTASVCGFRYGLINGTTNTMHNITSANWMNHGLAFGPKIGSFCIP